MSPIAWTGLEFLRCIGPLGFPMILLGHSQYRVLTMIQISDLVGAYGVSFVLAMINGLIVDFLIQPIVIHRAEKSVRMPMGTMAALCVFAGAIIYGVSQSSTRHLKEGPNVAMIQHDLSMYTIDNFRATERETFESFLHLTRASLAEKPDLVVLPETAINARINEEFLTSGTDAMQEMLRDYFPQGWTLDDVRSLQQAGKNSRGVFQKIADESNVSFVIGATAMEWKPTAIPARVDRYNSAYLLVPGAVKPVARYDKRHVVLFGEYVPFRYTMPWLYNWLYSLTPFPKDGKHYSLSMGESYSTFSFPSASNKKRVFRAAAPICYEEIMPYITREFTHGNESGRKEIDLLVPISNDGWFAHSTELEQHLAAGVFRAVENRIAVARSVNTGASAMIYPNGKIHSRVEMMPDQVANLDPLESALVALKPMIEELAASGADEAAFNTARRKISTLVNGDIARGYARLGPAFELYASRLDRLQGNQSRNPVMFERAVNLLRFHVDEEISAVRRWRHRPDTAPGFVVDQAMLDGRLTLYTRGGDWFAATLLGLTAIILLDWFQIRLRRNRMGPPATEGDAT
ncbi:MAG: apolipoprotein N-acyltransferase [Planctomycetes bacterium]|nr:apolipoprotein N-acyltransferase [Planctomycetota bacterium]